MRNQQKFETEKNNLKKASKTAMMWLGYQEMFTILMELLPSPQHD